MSKSSYYHTLCKSVKITLYAYLHARHTELDIHILDGVAQLVASLAQNAKVPSLNPQIPKSRKFVSMSLSLNLLRASFH
jgi:hypothetical protein